MLSFSEALALKSTIKGAIPADELQTIFDLPAPEAADTLVARLPDLDRTKVFAYLLSLYSRPDSEAGGKLRLDPNGEELYALHAQLHPNTGKWHKEDPPISDFMFRRPGSGWEEEVQAVSRVCHKISHVELRDDRYVAMAILNELGLGGWESVAVPQALCATNESGMVIDETMRILVGAVHHDLPFIRSEWVDQMGSILATLPEGVDGRSLEVIEAANRAAEEERKKAEEAERRARYREEASAQRAAELPVILDKAKDMGLDAVVGGLKPLGFDGLKGIINKAREGKLDTWLPEAAVEIAQGLAPSLHAAKTQEAASDPAKQEAQAKRVMKLAYSYIEDAVLLILRDEYPEWVRDTPRQDGSLTLVRSVSDKPKKEGPGKFERSVKNGLRKYIEKYGAEKVIKWANEVFNEPATEEAPAQEAPAQEAPAQEAPAQEAPAQEAPATPLATQPPPPPPPASTN
jgi:hypothetical protein